MSEVNTIASPIQVQEDGAERLQLLNDYIAKNLPALQYLNISVKYASCQKVVVQAPLADNHNDKGTAFGGSQFMMGIAAAWALVFINVRSLNLAVHPDLIGAQASIKYSAPFKSDTLQATSEVDPPVMQAFLSSVREKKKSKIEQIAILGAADNVASQLSVMFVIKPLTNI